jgi:hypothetical protein
MLAIERTEERDTRDPVDALPLMRRMWERFKDLQRGYPMVALAHNYPASCSLLRDIAGNHFQQVAPDPAWLSWNGNTVVTLAQAAYEERQLPTGVLDGARLAILADALEEAGCTDVAILNHCRGPGPHVRGCWVLDLLLGKA